MLHPHVCKNDSSPPHTRQTDIQQQPDVIPLILFLFSDGSFQTRKTTAQMRRKRVCDNIFFSQQIAQNPFFSPEPQIAGSPKERIPQNCFRGALPSAPQAADTRSIIAASAILMSFKYAFISFPIPSEIKNTQKDSHRFQQESPQTN